MTEPLTLDQIHALRGSAKSQKEAYLLAAQIIETPGRWCQGVCARNLEGGSEYKSSDLAQQWCAVGAIWMVASSELVMPFMGLSHLNDSSDSPAPVAAKLRELAEACK